MQPLTFADRFLFAQTRADRLFARESAKSRATQARKRRRCCFATSAGMGPEAMPRQLRWPWSGGYISLARSAGVDRIPPGRAPQISATCSAPVAGPALTFTAAIAA